MYELPTSITLDNGDVYPIRNNGDYRVILDVNCVYGDSELSDEEKVLSALIIFYTGFDDVYQILFNPNYEELYTKMNKFISAGDNSGAHCQNKMIDWEQDENLITSAINNIAKTEIRALPYLHWWTFIGYYMSIGECPLSTVTNIRGKLYKKEKLEKWEKEFISNNPNYFSFVNRDNNSDELLKSIWNKE